MKLEVGSRSPDISDYFRGKAEDFRSELDGAQRLTLKDELREALKLGAFLCWLTLVKQAARKLKLSQDEIARQCFVTRNAVNIWLNQGEIRGRNTWMLFRVHPRFRDLCFQRTLWSSGARAAITWIRRDVLSDTTCEGPLQTDQFEFLFHDQQFNDEGDSPEEAFERLPFELKTEFPGRDGQWLLAQRRVWGDCFGLFFLEMDGEDIWV